METKMWTRAYRPFIMGGNVNANICCTVEGGDVIELGKGFQGFVITTPKNNTVVVEKKSGAIIGNSIATVTADIEACDDIKVMEKQITEAIEAGKKAEHVTLDHFWRYYPL